jgi:hypothetical protein
MEPFPQPSHYIPRRDERQLVALHRCAQERPRGTSRPDPGNRSGAQVPHSLPTPRLNRPFGDPALHTVMAALMEDVLFELPELAKKRIVFDAGQVKERLARIVNDDD